MEQDQAELIKDAVDHAKGEVLTKLNQIHETLEAMREVLCDIRDSRS